MRIRPPVDQSFDLGDEYPDDTFNQRGYLNEAGIPKLCRLEFKVTTLTELKQCAVQISELNARLNQLAFDDEREDLVRIFHARAALAECQFHLKHIRSRQYRAARKHKGLVLGGRKQRDARASAVAVTSVGKLDGRWLADLAEARAKKNQGDSDA